MKRSLVNEIKNKEIGEKIKLNGWVQRRRDLGGLIFIDLRDASGFVQIVFNPDVSKEALRTADTLRTEFVIEAIGEVVRRDESQVNKNNEFGHLELIVEDVTILSKAATPPFQISDDNINEDIKLKYRYVDLKRQELQNILRLRHKTTKAVREFLDNEMFVDIETPFLSKSTPEDARDYLVPSRIHEGEFYALPQSPQIYKQLLMLGGFERYYQIVKCFRDEDLRADRQPEFTQIDIEKSFTDQEDIIEMNERLIQHVMKTVKGLDIPAPFPRITFDDAMARYGVDKPDTRFGMELKDLTAFSESVDFKVFKSAVESGGSVKAIVVKDAASDYSRKDIDKLEAFVKNCGAKGLAWMKMNEEGLQGPIAKFFDEDKKSELSELLTLEANDLILFAADKDSVVHASLGNLRNKLAKDLNLIDKGQFNFIWVTDWPLFEYDEE